MKKIKTLAVILFVILITFGNIALVKLAVNFFYPQPYSGVSDFFLIVILLFILYAIELSIVVIFNEMKTKREIKKLNNKLKFLKNGFNPTKPNL